MKETRDQKITRKPAKKIWKQFVSISLFILLGIVLSRCSSSASFVQSAKLPPTVTRTSTPVSLATATPLPTNPPRRATSTPILTPQRPSLTPTTTTTPRQVADEFVAPTTRIKMISTRKPEASQTPRSIRKTEEKIIKEQEKLSPYLGEITFSLNVPKDDQLISSNYIFKEGIEKIYAVFDYKEMRSGITWSQIWYLNNEEVYRDSNVWRGKESGTFYYYFDNKGKSLPPGNWVLELYIEDKLQSLGVFIVEKSQKDQIPSRSNKLAYTQCNGNHHNIYVADINGQNEQLLVTRGAGPSWSPDGRMLFFYGEEGVDRQLRKEASHIFDGISNGLITVKTSPFPTNVTQLQLYQPLSWKEGSARGTNVSPDGTMVAYDAKASGKYRIYIISTTIPRQFQYEIVGEQADWAPDSQKIVYRSGRNKRTGLWISDRDDTNHHQITFDGSDSFPAWSPDGQTIAFSREEEGNIDIYTVNSDGSDLQRLTDASGHDTLPTYTPEGEIIFRSGRTDSWSIWKMEGDGSDQIEIISDACVGDDWAYSRLDVSSN